ncbi:MAG: FtsX-like permease family protein [Lapillicoccus sp.]
MWAAIRYRRAQAVGLALLSALITACAVFAPLYERNLEQALLREGLTRSTVLDTAVTLDAVAVPGASPDPAQVRTFFPSTLSSIYDSGAETWTGQVFYAGVAGTSVVTVRAAQDTCRGLRVASGVCPTRPWQVVVSADEARIQGWKLGDQLPATESLPAGLEPHKFSQRPTIVGTYLELDDLGHWMGARLTGKAGHPKPLNADGVLMDDWVTPESTFASGWSQPRLSVTYLLDEGRVGLETLPGIVPAVEAASTPAQLAVPAVDVQTRINDLAAGVVEGQRQARLIVPLVMGQLALLAVVVLALVAAAAVEQRRPELALVRLRGRGGGGAARVLMLELGTIVALGVPVGAAAAVALSEVALRVWLTPGVPFEVPRTSYAAAAIALVVALVAVAAVARPTVREPISTLLRRVPPRRRGWSVGVTDAVVVAVAVAGVASIVSGNISGPLVLTTPTLIALAVGLVLAHVLVPVSAAIGRRFTDGGRVVGALTALQIARRPAIRRVMTIITVATAITVFATDAVVVGQRNRTERSQVETGSEYVLRTDATRVEALLAAAREADPSGTHATPVVSVGQGDASALRTMAVVPDQFAAVALFPRGRAAFTWPTISVEPPPEAVVTGSTLSLTLSDIAITAIAQGDPSPVVAAAAATVDVFLAQPGSPSFSVDMGSIPVSSRGPVTFRQDVACAGGCRITGFGLETPLGSDVVLQGRMTIGAVSVDGGAPVHLGAVTSWVPSGDPTAPPEQLKDYANPVAAAAPTAIGMEFLTQRSVVRIATQASAAPVPALVLGPLPPGSVGEDFEAAGLDGLSTGMTRVASIPYAPGGGDGEAVVNLATLTSRSDRITTLAVAEIWATDSTTANRVRTALQERGVAVTAQRSRADAQALLDNSASAWGLEMALVVGVAALVMAALVLVLVAATSARARSRDYAALRLAGVSDSTLRSVSLAEQLVVVVISVLAGLGCGALGARLAVPLVPFFTEPSAVYPIDTTPATVQLLLVGAAGLLVLSGVAFVVARALVSRATLDRVGEQL